MDTGNILIPLLYDNKLCVGHILTIVAKACLRLLASACLSMLEQLKLVCRCIEATQSVALTPSCKGTKADRRSLGGLHCMLVVFVKLFIQDC